MAKKLISVLTLVAFSIFTWSCSVYSTKKITPDKAGGRHGADVQVLRVMKTSGEIVEFSEKYPGYIAGDAIVGGMSKSIPLSEVELIWIKERDAALSTVASLGAAAGAVAGTILVIALIIALTKESCPFLYADDGTGFRLEGELYSGAIFKQIERADYLKLHYLAEKQGAYVLKIANEAQETQYTDELTLLVVDHPKDTGVFVGSDGLLHTIQKPLRATSAKDSKGTDFTATMAAPDGRMWSSSPFHRDPDNPEDLKPGIILEFPRPSDAEKAKLVVRLGNTYWADSVFSRFFGAMGFMMKSWYEQANQDPKIKEKAESFLKQRGVGLRVQLMHEGIWEDVGFFYPTGPFGIQDDILEFPIDKAAANTLTVKLDGGTFFWMVDYAAVDYSPDCPVAIHELAPAEAVDENGQDVKGFLLRSDDSYYAMPKPGNYAVLKFPVPPRSPEAERSFILKSEGYYNVHSREEGTPDLQALLSIQQNPDNFLKFSLLEFAKTFQSGKARPIQK